MIALSVVIQAFHGVHRLSRRAGSKVNPLSSVSVNRNRDRRRPILPSTFPHSWTFWSQFCDAVYVTQYAAFLEALNILFVIDGDFSLSLIVVIRYPLST